MAVNKVIYNTVDGEEILMDLTNDTVTPQTLAKGATAHDASGEEITGTMPIDVVRYGDQTLTEAQKAQARANIGAASQVSANGDDIEILIPSEAVAVVGVEFNIYYKSIIRANKSLDNYDIKIYLSDSSVAFKRFSECFRLTATDSDIGDYTLTVEVRDNTGNTVIVSKTMTLHIVENRTISNQNVLFIGDSLTFSRGGLYAAEIQYNLSNGGIVSIGTQTGPQASNTIGEVKHEGYNGAAVGGFLSANVISGFTNPFYNPTTKTFDLAYFMTNQGYSKVDAVCLNLGHNNIGNTANAVSGLTTIAEKIHAYNSNIPVIISLVEPLAGQDSWRDTKGYTAEQMRSHWAGLIKAYIAAFDNGKISNVYLSTPYFNIDPDNDFPTETVARSSRDTTQIVRQNDSMHPNRVGTLKMADAYFANVLYRIPEDDVVYYTITSTLTNVVISNTASTVKEGSSFSATLTAESGYELDTVSVTMGGSAVTVTNGVINIASVTGDIVITATAQVIGADENLVDPSTANDASPDTTTLYKDEWVNGYALSTSTMSVNNKCIVTDLFDVTYGQKIKITGILLSSTEHHNRFRWWLFDASGDRPYGSYVNFISAEGATAGGATINTADNSVIIDTTALNSSTFANIASARFSCYPAGENENIIVTIVDESSDEPEEVTPANLVEPQKATTAPNTTDLFADEYAVGYYISTSALSAKTGCVTVDRFPVTKGQKISVSGIKFSSTEEKNRLRWWFFDADGTRPMGSYVNFATGDGGVSTTGHTYDESTHTMVIDTSVMNATFNNVAYARFSCYPAGDNEDVIVSVVE